MKSKFFNPVNGLLTNRDLDLESLYWRFFSIVMIESGKIKVCVYFSIPIHKLKTDLVVNRKLFSIMIFLKGTRSLHHNIFFKLGSKKDIWYEMR